MSSNFGDVTIVGDVSFKHPDESSFSGGSKSYSTTVARVGVSKHSRDAFTTTDYTLHGKPFFVPISSTGVMAALHELDNQLLNVGLDKWFCLLILAYL
jgi:hypothetical protein